MVTGIITYDLSVHRRRNNGRMLYERLRAYADYAQITESSCAIKTSDTTVVVRDDLHGYYRIPTTSSLCPL